MVALLVIKMGRNRVSEASRMASILDLPCSCSLFANSTMRIPFLETTPTSVTNPT